MATPQRPTGKRTPHLPRWESFNARRALILALVICVLALTLAVPLRAYLSTRAELDSVNANIAKNRNDISKYEDKVAQGQDPAYIEEQARERLQMVKPGEKPFVIQYPSAPAESDEQRRAERQAANPWFTNLWQAVSVPGDQ